MKTHSGVRSEFSRLIIGATGQDSGLGRTSNKGYMFKDLADYGTGTTRVVTDLDAADIIDDAIRFVARVTDLLATPPAEA